MSLADPQSIKISGTTSSLPRVSTGDYRSKYESADGSIDLTLSTQVGKRKRQVVRVDVSKIIASALVPTTNEEASMSLQLVVDRPLVGYDNADAKAVYDGFIEALQASSSKIITQLLAGES